MNASRCVATAICGALLTASGFAADEPPRTHRSTATSDPQREAAADEPAFRIDRDAVTSPEWRAAVERAVSHQRGRGRYTLMRVRVENADPDEEIQAQATKLKALTEEYDGGGGEYRVLRSGGFLFWEHIGTSRRTNGRDPVELGAFSHGSTELWVDVPPEGVLGVLGDVVLTRCPAEEMGALTLKVDPPGAIPGTRLTIGPVVVGGPYGKTHAVDVRGEGRLPLPPGEYKILLPDFDLRNSRWDVRVEPRKTTRLTFAVTRQIAKTGETRVAGTAPERTKEPERPQARRDRTERRRDRTERRRARAERRRAAEELDALQDRLNETQERLDELRERLDER